MGDPPPPPYSIKSNEEYGNMVAPSFSPMLKGKFSLELSDEKLKFYPDTRSLAKKKDVLNSQSVSYDLKLSINAALPRNHAEHSRMKLESLLAWIVNEKGVAGSEFFSQPFPDFVCPIGVLADIMLTPFDLKKKPWSILATKYHGTIYLKKEEEESGPTSKSGKTNSAWGLKFEQYMTKGSDPKDPCDQNKAYYCVVRSELGSSEGASSKPVSHTLLYRAEVDAVDYTGIDRAHTNTPADEHGNLPHDLKHIVELKTLDEKRRDNLPIFIKTYWWSKAFLTGVPRITCGFRDAAGVVKTVKTYQVKSLPESTHLSRPNSFKPEIMTIFLNEILGYMKGCIVKDDPNVVYKLARDEDLVSCHHLTPFLPEAYVAHVKTWHST